MLEIFIGLGDWIGWLSAEASHFKPLASPGGEGKWGGSAVLFTRAAAAAPDGATDAPGAVTSEVTSSAGP